MTDLPFANNTITVYKYEPFSYTISNSSPRTSTNVTLNIGPYVDTTDTGEIVFSTDSNGYTGASSSNESIVINTATATSSNSVTVNPGRFFDSLSNSFNNQVFTFFKNEAITPIKFNSAIKLLSITTTPSLPPGLSFQVDTSQSYLLTGTPSVQIPSSNYLVIGTGTVPGTVVSTRVFGSTSSANGGVNIEVKGERIRLDLSGSSNVSPMTVNIPITPRVITARVPAPVSTTALQYSWSGLPMGLYFADYTGLSQSSPYTPNYALDPSRTLILKGTPTTATATSFIGLPNGTASITLNATRISPTPILSNSQIFSFRFGETVLFDTISPYTFYNNADVTPSSNSINAKTYFGVTDVSIENITGSGFPPGISLNFVSNQQKAYIQGTPTTIGSYTGNVVATNTNGVSVSNTAVFNISNDIVSFSANTPLQDTCYNFILSRTLDNPKLGYYTYPITFAASAASGKPVVLSYSGISNTGISLVNGTLTGTPTTVTPSSVLTVTATCATTGTNAFRSVNYEILNDQFTFGDIPFAKRQFVQNRQITSFQVSATTLSGRNIIGYSSSNLPSSLTISPSGLVSGKVDVGTGGVFNVSATTGFVNGTSSDISYTIVPDSILLVSPVSNIALTPGGVVGPIDIRGISYSGRTVSNYQFSNLSPTYGMTINSTSGQMDGVLSTSVDPDPILPASSNFQIKAFAGNTIGTLGVNLTTINPIINRSFMLYETDEPSQNLVIMYSDDEGSNWGNFQPTTGSEKAFLNTQAIDFQLRYESPSNNTYIITAFTGNPGTSSILRSSNYAPYVENPIAAFDTYFSSITNKPGTNTWWSAGLGLSNILVIDSFVPKIFRSDDDGVTWDTSGVIIGGTGFATRDSNLLSSNAIDSYYPYLRSGISLKYSSTVLLAGGIDTTGSGNSIRRSTDEGLTWSNVTGAFLKETAYFSLDHPTVWVATGSDCNKTENFSTPLVSGPTIKYSTDQGQNWSNATGGFDFFGYDIVYGNNTWVAYGQTDSGIVETYPHAPKVKFSTDGSNWHDADISTNPMSNYPASPVQFPPRGGAGNIHFGDSNWKLFTYQFDAVQDSTVRKLYTHDSSSSLSNGWSLVPTTTPTSAGVNFGSANITNMLGWTPTKNFPTGTPISPSLTFASGLGSGPTFTSPTESSFLFYQYLAITPITLSAVGNGQIYFFVENFDLPYGLSFDPVTSIISGAPVDLGQESFTVYARDSSGTTALVLSTNTIIPRIIRQQSGAGAYTSLLRQYTLVNAAHNSQNNLVYPNQEQTLGQFAAPDAPDTQKEVFRPSCDPNK